MNNKKTVAIKKKPNFLAPPNVNQSPHNTSLHDSGSRDNEDLTDLNLTTTSRFQKTKNMKDGILVNKSMQSVQK